MKQKTQIFKKPISKTNSKFRVTETLLSDQELNGFDWELFMESIIKCSGIPILSTVLNLKDQKNDNGQTVFTDGKNRKCNFEGYKELLLSYRNKPAESNEDPSKEASLGKEACTRLKNIYDNDNAKTNYQLYEKLLTKFTKYGDDKIWNSQNYLEYRKGFNPQILDFIKKQGDKGEEFKKEKADSDKIYFTEYVASYKDYIDKLKPLCNKSEPSKLGSIKNFFKGGWALLKMFFKCKKAEIVASAKDFGSYLKNNGLMAGLIIGLSAVGVSLFVIFIKQIMALSLGFVKICVAIINVANNFYSYLKAKNGKEKAQFLGNTIGFAISIPLIFFHVNAEKEDLDKSVINFLKEQTNPLKSKFTRKMRKASKFN